MKLLSWMRTLPIIALGSAAAACGSDDNPSPQGTTATGGAAGTTGSGGTLSAGSGGVDGTSGTETSGKGGKGGASTAGGMGGTGKGGTGGMVGTGGNGGNSNAGKGGMGGTGGTGGTGGNSGAKPITDDFERASLGQKWQIAYPTGGDAAQVQIVGSSDLGMNAGNQGFFLVDWIADTFTADQYSEAVISSDAPQTEWAYQPYVRRNYNLSPAPRYGFGYENDPNQPPYYQRWYFKLDGLAEANNRYFGLSNVVPSQQPKPGDTLRLEIQGYRLRGFWNGVLMIEATDTGANKIANGRPGLAARVASGNVAIGTNAKVWESFAAGGL